MEIDGKTRVIPHLAFPSAHLRTPPLFNARCRVLGLNAVVVPWEVAAGDLALALLGLRTIGSVAGMIVTIPHKEAVAPLCDRLEGIAAELGVANVIRRTGEGELVGALFDGKGFVAGLVGTGYDPAGKRALLLGAGGAGTALAHALLEAGVAELVIANRGRPRAERLATRLRALFPGRAIVAGEADASGMDLIVNATSVGLDGDPGIPLDPMAIAPSACVADIIMKPAMTPLLVAARARGARVHLGEHMLTAQIDHFIEFILGPGALRPDQTA